jgi:hypothetical protein
VVLDHVGPLLLDDQGPGLERLVVGVGVFLLDGADRLGLDASLGRVVDAAGEVAVGGGEGRGVESVFWKATKAAGESKKSTDPAQGDQLLSLIADIDKIFWETKAA